jgi:hypothetical protein
MGRSSLLDIVKPTLPKEMAFQQFGLDPRRRTIGLLLAVACMRWKDFFPLLLDSAHLLQEEIPDLQFVILSPPAFPKQSCPRG